jgi:autotransporter-associated beta strand protein
VAFAAAAGVVGSGDTAFAQTNLYWDANGATAGSGATPTGTWGSSAFWSTSSAGTVATGAYTAGSNVFFSAGSDATTYTVTVSGSQNANGITFQSGTATLSSGTLGIGTGGITLASTAGDASIGSAVRLTDTQAWTVATGKSLTVSGIIALNNALTLAGSGTFSFTNSSNTGTGKLTISDGATLRGINAMGRLGTAPSSPVADQITLNNGTIWFDNGGGGGSFVLTMTANRGITLGAGGGTLQTYAGSTLFLPNNITGVGRLTLDGNTANGNFVLTGTNNYSGGTTITSNVGSVRGNTLGLQGDISNASALRFDQMTDGTYSGSITGTSGSVSRTSGTAAAGTITFTGSSSYSSTLNVRQATLALAGSNGSFGSNAINLGTEGSADTLVAGNTLGGGAALVLDNTAFNNTNRLTGTANITSVGGTIAFLGSSGNSSSESLGFLAPSTGLTTISLANGAAAGSTSELTFSQLVDRGASASMVNITASGLGTLGGSGAGNSRVFFTGQANNTMYGWITVGGTAFANYTTATGMTPLAVSTEFSGTTAQNSTNVAFTASRGGASSTLNAARTINSLTVTSPGAGQSIDLSGNNLTVTSGGVLVNGTDPFEIKNTLTTGSITSTAPNFFVSDPAGQLTVSAPISLGANNLAKGGLGTLTLSGSNAGTGNVFVNSGTLRLAGGNAVPDASNVTLANSGAVTLALDASETIGRLISTNPFSRVIVAGGNTLTANNSSATTFSGVIDGSGNFVKGGSGDFTLNGPTSNTLTGTTFVYSGTLSMQKVKGVTAIAGDLVIGDGTNAATVRTVDTDNQIADTSTVTVNNAGYLNFAGLAGVDGAPNNFDNIALLRVKGFVNIPTLFTLGVNGLELTGGTGANNGGVNGMIRLGNSTGPAGVLDFLSGTFTTLASSATAWIDTNAGGGNTGRLNLVGDRTFAIADGGAAIDLAVAAAISGSGGLIKTGAGHMRLSGTTQAGSANGGANRTASYTGATEVREGTLSVTANNGLPSTTFLTIGGAAGTSGVFDMNNQNQTIAGLSSAGAGTGNTVTNSGATLSTLTVNTGSDSSYGGLLSGSMSLVKSGSGTLRLASGSSTYSGTTTVSAGVLSISNTTGGLYTVSAAGAGLLVGNSVSDATFNALRTSGSFVANSFIGFDTTGTRGYEGTAIANTAVVLGLMKIGSGTLSMNVANTYTGTTAINEGVFSLGVTNAIPASSPVVLSGSGSLAFGLSGSAVSLASLTGGSTPIALQNASLQALALTLGSGSYTGQFTGPGSLVKTGAGTLTLSGSNSYAGPTTLGGGLLALGNADALAGGGNILFTGGTMQFSAANQAQADYGARIASSTSAMAFDTNGQSVTFSTPLAASNVAGLTKVGSGTLTLAANNLYSGTTQISGGVLRAGGNSAFGSNSIVNLANTAGVALDLNGSSQSIGSLTGGGSTGGNVILGGGTLAIGSANTSGTFSGGFTGTPGTLVKQGRGVLALNGTTSSFTATTLEAGALTVSPTSTSTFALGTLNRSAGSGLNLQPGSGTITVDPSTPGSGNGNIIGPWAVTGSTTNLTYAAHSAGSITGYTASGTATNASTLSSFSSASNVLLQTATGSITSAVTANTIRYTGGALTTTIGSQPFTVNGLMNAGSGIWTIAGGTISISSETNELVVATNNQQIIINSAISGTSGQGLTVMAQSSWVYFAGNNTIPGPINVFGSAMLNLSSSGTYGAINLSRDGSTGLTTSFTGVQRLGAIAGVGATFTKAGTGTTTLVSTESSYTGKTTLSGGMVEISSLPNLGLAGGLGAPTTVANGTIDIGSSVTAATLRYVGNSNSTTDRVVNLAGTTGGATLDSSGSGALVFTSAFTATGNGAKTLTLTGSSTAANAIVSVPNSTGTTSIDKTGAGTWWLTGNSGYSGQLRVLDGTLVVGANVPGSGNSPFGAEASPEPIIGNSAANATGTASLLVAGGNNIERGFSVAALGGGTANQVVVLGATGTGSSQIGTSIASIRLNRSAITLQAADTAEAVFAGNWQDGSGNANPTVAYTIGSLGNAGVVVLESEFSSSATSVNIVNGTARLQAGANNRINSATPVTIGSGLGAAILDINGQSQLLSSTLTFTGNSGSITSGTLRLGGATAVAVSGTGHVISSLVALEADKTFNLGNASRLGISSAISGGFGLTKTGAGILELSGTSGYSGPTLVSAGSLLVNGQLDTSAVTVQSGGLLGGSGVLNGGVTVQAGGTFSPGNSPGLLTTSELVLAGATLMEIDGVSPRGGIGGFDAVNVTGALTYGGSMVIDFGSAITSAFADNTMFNLFDFGSYTGLFSSITTASDGSWYGNLTFTGTGDKWTAAAPGSQTLEFTHSTGVLVIVPEPGALALAGIGIAAAAWAARRRK